MLQCTLLLAYYSHDTVSWYQDGPGDETRCIGEGREIEIVLSPEQFESIDLEEDWSEGMGTPQPHRWARFTVTAIDSASRNESVDIVFYHLYHPSESELYNSMSRRQRLFFSSCVDSVRTWGREGRHGDRFWSNNDFRTGSGRTNASVHAYLAATLSFFYGEERARDFLLAHEFWLHKRNDWELLSIFFGVEDWRNPDTGAGMVRIPPNTVQTLPDTVMDVMNNEVGFDIAREIRATHPEMFIQRFEVRNGIAESLNTGELFILHPFLRSEHFPQNKYVLRKSNTYEEVFRQMGVPRNEWLDYPISPREVASKAPRFGEYSAIDMSTENYGFDPWEPSGFQYLPKFPIEGGAGYIPD
jgi:hypothetical protein